MLFNKKGAMELGISTVVMLVIAIVIIGAGIVFIRSFFGTGTETLIGAFEVADFGLEPTANRPLVLTDGQVNIKTGRQSVVRVGFYNRQSKPVTANVGFGKCVTSVSAAAEAACAEPENIKPMITSLQQDNIEIGAAVGFQTQVNAKCEYLDTTTSTMVERNLPAGEYTCNLIVYECGDIDGNIVSCDELPLLSDYHLESIQIIFSVTS
jgi:hypothetical protein